MTTSREQALGEGNCARVTKRGKEACECMGKPRVCRLPSERHSPLGCILTKSARLRTETSYKAGPVRRVSQTSRSRTLSTDQVKDEVFRPKRSAHGAAKQVQRTIRRGYQYAVDMDLSKFFDRCQHDVIMARVARKVDDKQVLKLIGRYLRAGVIVEGVFQPTTEGTPQGGPASPLLANILLDDLDKELGKRGLPFVRYADDFVIFTKSRRSAEQ